MGLKEDVAKALQEDPESSEDTQKLWAELAKALEESGPDSLISILDQRAVSLRKRIQAARVEVLQGNVNDVED